MPSTDHERRDALPVGTVLRDFTIQAVIGQGGFGVVYRAGHNELDLAVAIKEYLPVELAVREGATVRPRSGTVRRDFEEGLRRFRDEAQVLVGFDSHPSIVSCRDFFRANGTAYLVMAYEDGRSLAEVLASREAEGRPFTEEDLLAVIRPVLAGLARVHAAGVLHRDIKPSNILIRRRDERPVLIDFGAAKQVTARFSKSQAPYTEGYAALEQVADAGTLGPWTDMYGVGAVMWRIVAGSNRPWEPPHPVRVEQRSHAVVAAADDPMPSASVLGKGRFQPRLLEAIDRCLRLRETARIQGSHELLETLREAGGESIPESEGPVQAPDPADDVAGPKQEDVEAELGRETDDHRRVRLERSQSDFAQSWIGDWDALGEIQDPGFAETARAYIARYARIPAASVWVAKAEALVAKLRELETADRPQLAAGESWRNSLGMVFAWIPAGSFFMGSPSYEERRCADERLHSVRISQGFWIGKYEVTQEEWEAVMGENPSYFKAGVPALEDAWVEEAVMGENTSHFKECRSCCPVESVSWYDAQKFIRKLNQWESLGGYVYRLPTEAEWEYAARAGTTEANYGELEAIAWYGDNSELKTYPVGQKRANAWGLHDMIGNVWEWTADWYAEYPSVQATNPQGPTTGSRRVVRGGSWEPYAGLVRSALRNYHSPDESFDDVGFRLIRTKRT